MSKTNADWHRAHRMPENPTEGQRLAWHVAHAAHCGCREIPKSILELTAKREIAVPVRDAGSDARRAARSA